MFRCCNDKYKYWVLQSERRKWRNISCFVEFSVESLLSAFIVLPLQSAVYRAVLRPSAPEMTDGHDSLVMAGHQTHEPPQSWSNTVSNTTAKCCPSTASETQRFKGHMIDTIASREVSCRFNAVRFVALCYCYYSNHSKANFKTALHVFTLMMYIYDKCDEKRISCSQLLINSIFKNQTNNICMWQLQCS